MNNMLQSSELKSACQRARDEKGFTSFTDLCVVDRTSDDSRFECIYRICNPKSGEQTTFSIKVPEHEARVDTVSDIWPAATWFELEATDLFGIVFRGNENSTRLLTPDDFKGHPLRKDFGG